MIKTKQYRYRSSCNYHNTSSIRTKYFQLEWRHRRHCKEEQSHLSRLLPSWLSFSTN